MMKLLALATLLLASSTAWAQNDCTLDHCGKEAQAVLDTEGGMETITCLLSCDLQNLKCPYDCGYYNTEIPTHQLFQCQSNNGCLPSDNKPTFGTFLGTNEDAVPNIAEMDFFSGEWWNVKGIYFFSCTSSISRNFSKFNSIKIRLFNFYFLTF